MHIEYRAAQLADISALEELIAVSARRLQGDHYSAAQTEGAIGTVFGVDSQLIKDGTYFVAVSGGKIVGCGGWSKRKTLYGADRAKTKPDPLRDPRTEPAMIRAFFIHPEFARRGIGRELVRLSEAGASAEGFREIEIIATLPGEILYSACGYVGVERFDIALTNGLTLPVVRMKRSQKLPAPDSERTPG
jgi:GNAT superfamily N-acetyltransferase